MKRNPQVVALLTVLALVSFSGPALAQDLFAAPVSILTQIRAFITGANGILLGGAAVALAGISAASPRVPVTWGHFFVIIVVLGIFYGAFGIAEAIQGFAT
ncbi:TrbC/VirB2 family protein [Ruegeria atlantica]|uniref:TrbC/VirB2 family protein n=1 Tax=Ruegeria atlantica TaxID=81569 RepID=UPI00147D11AB|nr:TrbC/VirB2 family protein [Ruegeria atlantica]